MLISRWAVRAFLLAVLAAGCGTRYSGPLLPEFPMEETRCRVAASQSSLLVTEWPASEKANLEALLSGGGVAVVHSGCSMRIVPQCRLSGGYVWQRTTPSADILEINSEDDLYAKLPLGAANLSGELKRSGKLSVQTYVSGQLRLENAGAQEVLGRSECEQATHVVGGLAVGAFAMSRGGTAEASASAGMMSKVEAGGRASRSAGLVRAAGDPQMCGLGTDQAPHPNCNSPIQVFLWPVPGRVEDQGPPGTVKVDFVAASANGRWDVYVDDEVACTTPCTRWVDPSRPLLLRAREDGFLRSPDKIRVSNLKHYAAAGILQLQAHGTANGQLATGITFTTFGGMGVITGITFTSLGCLAEKSEGMCTGGLITLGVGGLVTLGSIWLMLDSLPRAEVMPAFQASLGADRPVVVRVGPGFVTGSF